ncbi:MAG: hypothetical protein U5L72_01135 [Bacteroidales bacterium]|nr:hypothetical protein [Bacteroidales bacterium]
MKCVQTGNEGYLQRKVPPFEGEVCYDMEGTIQGLWFMPENLWPLKIRT